MINNQDYMILLFLQAMAGFIINIVAVLVLVLATETWGDAIFGFHTLPAAFKALNVTASNSTLKC